ncbi:MAG TPA: DmsE family decaheme c-type cytochrome [Vicinamibacterales bacterium]|nr:DmsE family decaheme c-type cytochrome [Vicinamibacterales bacterium]
MKWIVLAALPLCAVTLYAAQQNPAQPASPSPSATAAATQPKTPAKDEYVGDDTCMACHESEAKSLASTLHGKAKNERAPAARLNSACETCHGPGKEHSETGDKAKIRVFTSMKPRDVSAVCTSCHNRSTHALWKGSVHDARNLSCISCHSVHSPKSEYAQLKADSITDTCVTCHKTEVAKLQRFGHMPVREGKMQCTSCHNPHGTTNVRLLKVGNWINESCFSCHTEKRGPNLWEHAPVRDACNTCHDPHGSNNERMLVAKLPMLCQRCHIGTRHPSTIYDGVQLAARSNRLIGRGCVNCHSQIHGSNSPAGNAFLR